MQMLEIKKYCLKRAYALDLCL